MRCLVDDEALDLVEHRRVRLVAVAAIDTPRRDDADRRRLLHHGADLHRARVRAQKHAPAVRLGAEIERVVLLARGMLGRDVELGEVQVIRLDVGSLGDREAQIGEDLHALVEHLADRMDAPLGNRAKTHGQRDVGPLVGKLLRESVGFQRALSPIEGGVDAFLDLVDRGTEALAILGRHGAERGHQCGDAALLAQRRDTRLLQRGKIPGGGNLAQELGFERLEVRALGSAGHATKLETLSFSALCRGPICPLAPEQVSWVLGTSPRMTRWMVTPTWPPKTSAPISDWRSGRRAT